MANSAAEVTEVQAVKKQVLAANALRTVAYLVNESGSDVKVFVGGLSSHSHTIPGWGPNNYLVVTAASMAALAFDCRCDERPLIMRVTNIE